MLANAEKQVLTKADEVFDLELSYIGVIIRAARALDFIAETRQLNRVRIEQLEVTEGTESGTVALVVVVVLIAVLAVV